VYGGGRDLGTSGLLRDSQCGYTTESKDGVSEAAREALLNTQALSWEAQLLGSSQLMRNRDHNSLPKCQSQAVK